MRIPSVTPSRDGWLVAMRCRDPQLFECGALRSLHGSSPRSLEEIDRNERRRDFAAR